MDLQLLSLYLKSMVWYHQHPLKNVNVGETFEIDIYVLHWCLVADESIPKLPEPLKESVIKLTEIWKRDIIKQLKLWQVDVQESILVPQTR